MRPPGGRLLPAVPGLSGPHGHGALARGDRSLHRDDPRARGRHGGRRGRHALSRQRPLRRRAGDLRHRHSPGRHLDHDRVQDREDGRRRPAHRGRAAPRLRGPGGLRQARHAGSGPRRPRALRRVAARRARSPARTALFVGALGVVFGDIGTSPIYTMQTVFNPSDPHPIAATRDTIFGITSMIFWSVTVVVTVTYVFLVMRADNDGEGGIMALITLLRRGQTPGGRRTKVVLAGLGIFGASLFFGDSMITPAISVLSAVEGLKVVQPSLEHLIVPITA